MATGAQSFYELYRRSSIGLALTDTLDDLISDSRIDPQLAMKILGNFDQAITEALQKNVKSRLQFKVITLPPVVLMSRSRCLYWPGGRTL